MTGWKAKRFWKAVTVEKVTDGFEVRLDGRSIKTPAKSLLVLPTSALAQAIAAEWDAQMGEVRPATMPMTRYANSAIDKVRHQFEEVASIVSAYGASDLICYRAPAPDALIARQNAAWDPLLEWSARALAAPLIPTIGIVPIEQPADSIAALGARVSAQSPFELAALHDLVAITGSLVLGLAVQQNHLTAERAFALSRIDEHYQAELWGRDEDAAGIESLKAADLSLAARFLHALT